MGFGLWEAIWVDPCGLRHLEANAKGLLLCNEVCVGTLM